MLYPLTFVVPAAMFHKHRTGNILSVRNLDRCFSPATLHSTRARPHSPSPCAGALSFLSHASDTFKHLTISPFYVVCQYNLWQQQCQHGTMFPALSWFSSILPLLFCFRTIAHAKKKKKIKTDSSETEMVPGVHFRPDLYD